jgi:hypothetical protein
MSHLKNITYIVFVFLFCTLACNCQEELNPNCETIGSADFCFCNNDTSCSNEQFSCLYRPCRIFCNGENSCQNLTVYVEEHVGFVLGCNGLNACLGIWVLGPMFDNNPCPNNSTEPEPTQQIPIDPTNPTEPTDRLSTGVTLGIFFGIIGIVILFIVGIFLYKHVFTNNVNTDDRIRMI